MMALHLENIGVLDYPARIMAAKRLYFELLDNPDTPENRRSSADFIERHIADTQRMPSPIPQDLTQLQCWLEQHNQAIGRSYQEYLDARKAGAPRRYFKSKAHALNFIRAVAPTKLVDGSWLYGLSRHWRDQRLSSLIQIYLEELGDGDEAMNHVVLYRGLLKANECEDWKDLPEAFFTQGAIQLALASHGDDYLPEIIGFNLAYEQLPLHLLITAYELTELNIDPYYFTLHITIDNALSGHANRAMQALTDCMPQFGDQQEFIRRVVNGAKLNDAGLGTVEIIDSFDLQAEMIRILQKKATLGQHMHSDRCSLQGKTLNAWLGDSSAIPELLTLMQQTGWIKRHADPKASRLWNVIAGERAPMFGVFTKYERQVIYDWIAGDALESLPKQDRLGKAWRQAIAAERPGNEYGHGNATRHDHSPIEAPKLAKVRNIYEINKSMPVVPINKTVADKDMATQNLANQDLDSFKQYVNSIHDENKRASLFIEWMSPSKHHTAIGLFATRNFKTLLN